MTETEAVKVYDLIRSYYNFYTTKQAFVSSYLEEFAEAPDTLIYVAVDNYCKRGERKPPTISDVKDYLLRKKWVIESDLIQLKLHGQLTKKKLDELTTKREQLIKSLHGYGSELEEEDAKQVREYRNTYGEPKPMKPFTAEELQAAEDNLLEIGQLYDL